MKSLLSISCLVLIQLNAFAWQIAPPDKPIEDRPGYSWWWWIVGVIITFAVGMLIYVWIKKNPKKDAR